VQQVITMLKDGAGWLFSGKSLARADAPYVAIGLLVFFV
jgi:hypothetical protein